MELEILTKEEIQDFRRRGEFSNALFFDNLIKKYSRERVELTKEANEYIANEAYNAFLSNVDYLNFMYEFYFPMKHKNLCYAMNGLTSFKKKALGIKKSEKFSVSSVEDKIYEVKRIREGSEVYIIFNYMFPIEQSGREFEADILLKETKVVPCSPSLMTEIISKTIKITKILWG